MSFDVDRARADTPGCADVLHFNNAGAALQPRAVLDAVRAHLDLEARCGGYEAEEHADAAIEHAYAAIASMLGCAREEIALIENATRAWDMAFYSLQFRPGDRILTGQAEYASNVISFLQVAARSGAEVVVVPDDEHGQISVPALRNLLDDRTKLIALTHVPTNGGLVNPAAAVGAIARAAGVPYLLDACQSVGQMPLRVDELGCDMLSATGRKFLRAPRGTGFLYVRRQWIERLEPPFLDLHSATWTSPTTYQVRSDARRFENWESYVAGRIGLGAAVDYALEWNLATIFERVSGLASRLRQRLSAIPGVVVHDKGEVRCGIVTFLKAGEDAQATRQRLRIAGINAWVAKLEYSRFDMEIRRLPSLVRASVHYYNTEEEIERFCAVLASA